MSGPSTCKHISTSREGERFARQVVADWAALSLITFQVARRVRLVVWLLRLMGLEREAQRLQTGHQQWDEANSLKNDIGLLFRCVWGGWGA